MIFVENIHVGRWNGKKIFDNCFMTPVHSIMQHGNTLNKSTMIRGCAIKRWMKCGIDYLPHCLNGSDHC
jgi:hypothetical protein